MDIKKNIMEQYLNKLSDVARETLEDVKEILPVVKSENMNFVLNEFKNYQKNLHESLKEMYGKTIEDAIKLMEKEIEKVNSVEVIKNE